MDSYSVDEAAAVLGVRKRRIWELVARGVLAGVPEEGGGMRIFLQGKPVVPSTSQPAGHRETNGNGGGHLQPSFDATPFRDLLTEFRSLTERYGQALLALGEARGEVAALRTRVELLEARVDLRLPPAAPPFSWARPPAAAEASAEPEPAPEPEAGDSGPAAAWPESPAVVPEPEAVVPEPEAVVPEPEAVVPEREVVAAPEAIVTPGEEAPSVPTESDQPRRAENRARRKGDVRSAVAGLGEALARAEDPSLSILPGAEEAASAIAELQREVAAEQESTLHEPETMRFPDELELTQPVADEAPTIEAPQTEPLPDEPDDVMVAESVAASEHLADAFLADDALGAVGDAPDEAPMEAEVVSAEPDLEVESQPQEPEVEVANEPEPEMLVRELELEPAAEHEEPMPGEGDTEVIGSPDQAPRPAAPVSYSSEWDEPDWIAEEDIEEPLAEPMSPADIPSAAEMASGELAEADAPLADHIGEEPVLAGTATAEWTEESPIEVAAIEEPAADEPIEFAAIEPEVQPIEFEAVEPEVQPIEFEAVEPEGQPVDGEAEPEVVAAEAGMERADVGVEGDAEPGQVPEPIIAAELSVAAADRDAVPEPEPGVEREMLVDDRPGVESETAAQWEYPAALPELEPPRWLEPEPGAEEQEDQAVAAEPSFAEELNDQLAPFLSGGVAEEEPRIEEMTEPIPLAEEPSRFAPWAELDAPAATPEADTSEPSAELAADAELDTSAGEIAAASVERGVEEEVMWLGGGFEETPPSPPAEPPIEAWRLTTPPRRVSPAEDQALSRLAMERGWDEDELTAIRSLLAQPAPRAGFEASDTPPVDVRADVAEPPPASIEVAPEEVATEPAMEPETAAELDDEAFDWEQGPAAWSPTSGGQPSADLPGGVELDEAMAQLHPPEPSGPLTTDEPEAQAEPPDEPDAAPSVNESALWAKAFPSVPESPAEATSPASEESPAEVAEPGRATVPPPFPFVRPQNPDWLRGRRGPAASAYRRLRRLFPG